MRNWVLIPTLLIALLGCEIDDDFGEQLTEDTGILLSAGIQATDILWVNSSKILALHNGLSVVDVNTRTVTPVSAENFTQLCGMADENSAVVVMIDPGSFRYFLAALNVGTGQLEVLSQNVAGSYYGRTLFAAVRDHHVAYTEFDEINGTSFLYVHDLSDGKRAVVANAAFALAFSPDGSKLLYRDDSGFVVTYDLASGATSTVNGFSSYGQVYWNETGIVEYLVSYGSAEPVLHVRNPVNWSNFATVEGISSQLDLFISADGSQFVYPQPKCANPAYVYNCYEGTVLVVLYASGLTGSRDEIARVSPPDYETSAGVVSGDFSPDGTRFAFSRNTGIYLVEVLK